MKEKRILEIFSELKRTSMEQRKALKENDLSHLLSMQKKRNGLLKEIEGAVTLNHIPLKEKGDFTETLRGIIADVLMIDNEIKQFLKKNMVNTVVAMNKVKRVKKHFLTDRRPSSSTLDLNV
ncbi:MAG TPA: hypothetical protein ENK09_00340 [Nitrospirae bacterium]|nr:hypothetical protein [Nitrospirota bacterium]